MSVETPAGQEALPDCHQVTCALWDQVTQLTRGGLTTVPKVTQLPSPASRAHWNLLRSSSHLTNTSFSPSKVGDISSFPQSECSSICCPPRAASRRGPVLARRHCRGPGAPVMDGDKAHKAVGT